MRTAVISGGRRRRRVLAVFLDQVARQAPGLRIGGIRVSLASVAAFAVCEGAALVRYRSVWREQPGTAIRRTVLLLPVFLSLVGAMAGLVYTLSPPWGVAEISVVVPVVAWLLAAPGWVRLADARRAGLSLRALAPRGERARIAVGAFWAYPPGHGYGRRMMSAVLAVADSRGVVLELKASCRRLVREVYQPLGFEPLPGQEHKAMPKLRREPTAGTAHHQV